MKQIGLIWRERVVEGTEVRKQSTRQSFVRAAALEVDGARRMRLLFVCVLLAALLTLLLGTRVIHAAVVERSLEELALSADLILHGTVKTMKSAWNDDKTMIYTKVVVSVTNQIKGQTEAKEVIIQVPGGVVDNMGLAVSGMAEFAEGEQVMVFLAESKTADYELLSGWQGKYRVDSGWVYNEGVKQPMLLSNLINQVVDIMEAHDIPSSLQPDWEQNLPPVSATPPDFEGVSIAAYVYNNLHWPTPNAMGEDVLANTNVVDDNDVTGNEALDTILAAANTWNVVPTADFVFTYGGTSDATDKGFNNLNEITFKDRGQNGVLATTYYWYNPSTGLIVESDMVINDTYNWDVTGSPSGGEFDLQSVVLHEFGHYLSLGHDDNPEAVMYFAISPGTVKRSLHQNDIDGISFIYPGTAPTPTDTPAPTATPTDTPVPTATPTDTPVPTATPTSIPTDTPTPTSSPTEVPGAPCPIPGDVDNSTVVDINDVLLISERWRATSAGDGGGPGLAPYESTYDLDFDLDVDIVDIMTAAAAWGNTCQPAAPIVIATPTEMAAPTETPTPEAPEVPLAGAARGAPNVWPAVLAVAILAVLVGALIWRGLRVR